MQARTKRNTTSSTGVVWPQVGWGSLLRWRYFKYDARAGLTATAWSPRTLIKFVSLIFGGGGGMRPENNNSSGAKGRGDIE